MFSSRLPWQSQLNRISEAVQQRRSQGKETLDLTESNPTRAGLQYPPSALTLADPRAALYQPDPAGLLEARESISAYYSARRQTVTPDRIVLTASTSESYAWLFKLLADAGDEVLVPRPSYPLFEFLAALENVHVVQYPLLYDEGWQIDFFVLEKLITAKTRALVLVNPNNPTGSFLKRDEWNRLAQLCRDHNVAVICDEVFADFVLSPHPQRVESLAGCDNVLTFSLSGLSKVCGLPQMKLGWIVVSGPPDQRAEALARLELIADTYLSVSTPVQMAARHFLALRQEFQTTLHNRLQTNLAHLTSHPECEMLRVEGGWCATLRVPNIRTEEEWVLGLLDSGVLVQPGFFFDFESEAYLVVSLLTEPEVFRQGAERIFQRSLEW
jgi:alanine-synthesizing transaminase